MAKKGQKFNKYDLDFKFMIIKKHIDEGKSTGHLSRQYGIPSKTIDTWVYQYRHGNRFEVKRGKQKNDDNIDYKERYEILKKYQAFLKEQRMKR